MLENVSRVMARIEAIEQRLGVPRGPSFRDALDAQLPTADMGGPSTAASVPFSSFGTVFGVNGILPVTQLPTVMTSAELDRYLATHGVEERNGHLATHELQAVSGAWDDRPARLLPPAAAAWEQMRRAAAADGVDLRTIDTYRSWNAQAVGHEKYLSGEKDAYVAPPGHSEHGEGLAVDVTNGSLVGPGSVEWSWLRDRAADFGWHPISNESWHWEFRGR